MFAPAISGKPSATTSHRVVLPFYIYASLSFLAASLLLFTSSASFLDFYFNPHTLAVTHIMTLGWASMMIIGASHQLFPVIIEGRLYSNTLAYLSFIFAAIGIPLLIYGFYFFNMKVAEWGAPLIALSIIAFLANIAAGMLISKTINVHAVYIFTATLWLLFTVILGLILVYNFTIPLLHFNSMQYLPLHAHAGIIGWFLLMVTGISSRLLPMFLISKYSNTRLLRIIYFLINAALICYLIIFYFSLQKEFILIPVSFILIAVLFFIYYSYRAYRQRLRRQVDEQVKLSLLAVLMIAAPAVLLAVIIVLLLSVRGNISNLVLAYGFLIFFGWLTAIIFGMTFKTLPFIVWNKVYHRLSASGKTPNPKDLFSYTFFRIMCIAYLIGFVLFTIGILGKQIALLKSGAAFLIVAAFFYNWNVIKVIKHKAVMP